MLTSYLFVREACDPPSALAQAGLDKETQESDNSKGIDLVALNRASTRELEAGVCDGVMG